jgi:CheY-like chemotaxis protein
MLAACAAIVNCFSRACNNDPHAADKYAGRAPRLRGRHLALSLHGLSVNARSRSSHLPAGRKLRAEKPLNTEGIVHILFIDDHKDSADAFGEIASGLGHKVQVAYDGRAALELTQAQSFDVVFFDIELPDADGRELCRKVREDGASRDACVIAVTGRTDLRDDDLEPFDGYLHKPISAGALERALRFSEG